MKWIIVVFALLNVAAFLLGLRSDPETSRVADTGQYETINAAAMTVITPVADENASGDAANGLSLEEESITRLKVDDQGQVLKAVTESEKEPSAQSETGSVEPAVGGSTSGLPEIVPTNLAAAGENSAPAPKPVAVAKIDKPAPEPPAKAAANEALACYRIGPFSNQKNLAGTRRELENSGIKYSVDERGASKNIKAVRVYLGAYSNPAALEAEVAKLKKMKIENFVIRLNGTPLVQLGYFSEAARAKAYQKTLKSRGIEAKTDTIYKETKIKSWLDVQLATKGSIDALRLPNTAKAREHACR